MGMKVPVTGKRWQDVDIQHGCPVCGAKKWCRVSSDGTRVCCRHEPAGAYKAGNDKTGAPYYIHSTNGAPLTSSNGHPRPSVQASTGSPKSARIATLDAVYNAVLDALPLSAVHRQALNTRGLTDAEIDPRKYRTADPGLRSILTAMGKKFGALLLTVPGFYEKGGKLHFACTGGLLIPARDTKGRIKALSIKPDNPRGKDKYLWVSSKKHGGLSSGAPAHVSLGTPDPSAVVRITEGGLKADVTASLSGLATIGAPGVSIWRLALKAAIDLGAKTIRLAYDADYATNHDVAKALESFATAILTDGLALEMERWDPANKGIDDALAAGAKIDVLPADVAMKLILDAVAATAPAPAQAPPAPAAAGQAAAPSADQPIVNLHGVWGSCLHNSLLWLRTTQPTPCVRYDEFRHAIHVDGEPISDEVVIDLTARIEAEKRTGWSQDHMRAALLGIAKRNRHSSLADWLRSLKWDKKPRLKEFFHIAFGAEKSDYTEACARIMFAGAVARAFGPGCKMDVMIVLTGQQGIYKSTGIEALSPDPLWYTDDLGCDLFDRKAGEGIRGKWLIEFSEFERINRATVGTVKAFLTRKSDYFRPPYARNSADFPRACIFIGTTNEDEILADVQNRRFMPVRCIAGDLDWIIANRDQLWAEAVDLYGKGPGWWMIDSVLMKDVVQRQEEARQGDVWEEILGAHFWGHSGNITIEDAAEALKIPIGMIDKRVETRIGQAFAKLKYHKSRPSIGGVRTRVWRITP